MQTHKTAGQALGESTSELSPAEITENPQLRFEHRRERCLRRQRNAEGYPAWLFVQMVGGGSAFQRSETAESTMQLFRSDVFGLSV